MAGICVFSLTVFLFHISQAENHVNTLPYRHIWKRGIHIQCRIPQPLEHGQFRVNPRVCPSEDTRAICQLLPGIPTPDLWVLYYSCHPEYELSSAFRASVCREGKWLPALPVCIPSLNMLAREQWGFKTDTTDFLPKELPSSRVIIAHTATSPCSSRAACIVSAQSIQQYHIQQYGDIGYNFLVGGDSSVMEGQGWDKIGAHTFNYNTHSICIALIGNFVNVSASQPALTAVKRLIERGVALGKLSADYKLYAHCQLIQIASPGLKVFDEISNWPHWDPMNALQCSQ